MRPRDGQREERVLRRTRHRDPVLLRERVVPAADIITPNQFELGFLTETEPSDLESTLASADAARAMGPDACS